MSKIDKGLKIFSAAGPVFDLAKEVFEIKKADFYHDNQMQNSKYNHQSTIEKANGIAKYRSEISDLSSKEKESLTEGFIKLLIQG